jgi:PAS domain S-box-containing protein
MHWIQSSRSVESNRFVRSRRRASFLALFPVTNVLLLATSFAWGFGIRAQAQDLFTVREALDYQNGQPVSGHLGRDVTVVGILTNAPLHVGANSGLADMQDSTGGIALYFPTWSASLGHFKCGDEVRVSGTIEEYEGQTEIRVHNFGLIQSGQVPPPRDVLVLDLHGIRYLGQLVSVQGKITVRKKADGANELMLRDRSGEVPIYLGRWSVKDPVLFRLLSEGGAATIVGVASYFQPIGHATAGTYRLIPRGPSDFVVSPSPPYKAIAIGIAFFVLALLQTYLLLRRRSAARRVIERTTFLSALVEGSPLAILVTSPTGEVRAINPAFSRMFGYSPGEALGKKADDLVAYGELAEEGKAITQQRIEGKTIHAVTRRKRKDGSYVDVEINAVPLNVQGEIVGGYAIYQDITERKQFEEHLRRSQKMQAIGQLAGGVSHDFNNLLTVIKGNAELLLSRPGQDEFLCKHTGEINKAANQATALVRQLLAFSRMQVLQPKVLDLNSVVAESVKMLPRLLRENIEVVFIAGESLGRVTADQNQIEQVILNLAVNARDAMPEGGRFTLETSNADLDENYAHLRPGEVKPGKYVMLSVTDTGMGMDAETQARIFEPFFTTKGPGNGTGLGLATVYGIVKQSGGWIWVYSELGRGTVFKIYFPKVEKQTEKRESTGSHTPLATGTETILLVEDQDGIRDLIGPFLQNLGYEVLEAPNGEAGLRLARQYQGKIQLLLTDVVMPRMGGYQLAKLVTEIRPEVQIIYMSGYAEYSECAGTSPHNGEFRLQKPFALDALARRVREALDAARQSVSEFVNEPAD